MHRNLSNEERYAERFKESEEKLNRLKNSPIKWVYTFNTVNDLSVCDHCKLLNEKTFNIEEAIVGVNYPPLKGCTCDFCRCYASHDIAD